MRRFLIAIEVADSGEPNRDGAPLYAFHSADQIVREFKHHIKDPHITITVKVAEELIP